MLHIMSVNALVLTLADDPQRVGKNGNNKTEREREKERDNTRTSLLNL